MPKKRTLCVIFLALVLVGFAARGPIVSTFFEWYLKGYCRTCLGSRLTYENLRHENDQWIFDHPVLTTKKRLEEGGYRFQGDKAAVQLSISWLDRSLSLSVHVEKPHLDIGKGAEDLRAVLEKPTQTFHLFEVHTTFHVPRGTIFVHDFTEDHLVPVPLFFHINLACRETREGCAALWIGEEKNENEGFIATFFENEWHEPQINFLLKKVECSSLQPILKGIWPQYKSFEVSNGTLSGNVEVTFSENSQAVAKGQINLKDLVLNHAELGLEVAISEAALNLTPKENEDEGRKFVNTTGNLDISSSKIELRKDGQPFWKIEGAIGTAAINKHDYANFSINGIVEDHGKLRHLIVNGSGRFLQEGQTSFNVDMQLKGEEPDSDTYFHFSTRELSDQWSFGEVELLGFGIEELDLAKHIIGKKYPQWQQVHLHQGNIDASILVYLKGFHLSEVNVERIAAHQLAFSFDPWNLNAGVERAIGSLSFDLSGDDPLKTLNADLNISEGKLNLEGLDNAPWQLSEIDTNLTVHQGTLQKSLLKGTVAGLQGEIELDGTSSGPLIVFNFHGDMNSFAQALPDPVRRGIDKEFTSDELNIIAYARRKAGGFLFNGKISVETINSPVEEILFGFTLDRSSQGLWKHLPPTPDAAENHVKSDLEAVNSMIPAIAKPMYSAYHHLISQNLVFAGFTLKDGWFLAEKLPLHKYISPFLFRNDQMRLGGTGKFSGQFDEQKLAVNYDAQDMVLENSDFAIEIKSLSEDGLAAAGKLPAALMYDFDKKTSFNGFPIRNATYFEKNSGLLYTEINADLNMMDSVAHFDGLTAFCNGLYFAGSASVDWSMPGDGVFEVDMHAHEMHGKISQLQHLLSHLNKSLIFLKIPIEGNVSLHKKGGHLRFSFNGSGYELESVIQGAMTDGKINEPNIDLSLQELAMNFDYDHKGNTLDFSDIQGTLLVGKPSHVEEYAISGNGLRFTDYSKDEAEFDVWIGDKSRDIIRLAGRTRKEINEGGAAYVNIMFNKSLTHFGGVHPSKLQLAFKDWSQLELFQLTCDFQMKTLLSDLQRFSRSGLFFLSRGILKELNDIEEAQGGIKAELSYDSPRSTLNYRIEGDDLAFKGNRFDKFLFAGTKKGSLWSVDQMQLDHISLAFDVLKEGSFWNINFLGARLNDYLLIGLEGQYSEDDSRLEARINLFEADLSRINAWPLLKSSFNGNMIEGQAKATGALHAEFDKSMPQGMHLNLHMTGSLTNAKIKSFRFEDIQDMSFRYDSSRGFAVNNVNLEIKPIRDAVQSSLFLQEASYNIEQGDLAVDGLHFDIPAENLAWTVQRLQEEFPDKMTEPVAEAIRTSKNLGVLQGVLNLTSSENFTSLRLHLNDGRYHFMGKEHDLSGFVIDYDPFSLKIFTEYLYQKQRLRLDAHSSVAGFDSGELILSNLSEGSIPLTPLTIYWKIHPQAGYYIQKMSGNLSGMAFDLIRDPNISLSAESINLVGKLDLNFRKAGGMMDEQIAAKAASLELGEGYSLTGQWSILKAKSKPLSDSLFFRGELFGRNFEFYGYRFYNLSGQLSYSPESAHVRSLVLADTAGSMQIEQMDFSNKGNGYWQMSVPAIIVNDLRPSLLNSARTVPSRAAKSLVIRSLNINGLNGMLGDKNSFIGNGQLIFANPPKKNLQPSILAIPSELLTRIGLDLAVLTPARGTVTFDIKDGKASLQRFKDVYSKGRLSKFYLANNGYDSYIDFDGNLNLQVRMKQYNIIFKLAELFTFNVQGTLSKPTYTLQKQQKQEEVANTR